MSYLQCLANVVAILHESLLRKGRIEALDEALALASAIDDNALCARGLRHCHTFADAVNKGLFTERLDNARNANDRDASLNTQSGIEGALGYRCTIGHGDGDGQW